MTKNTAEYRKGMERLLARIDSTKNQVGVDFPVYSDPETGRWVTDNGWTAPFWIGMQWLAYRYTQDESYKSYGLELMEKLDPYPARFQYFIAGVLGSHFTAEPRLSRKGEEAACYLLEMYDPSIEQVPAFPDGDDVIVDVLPSLAVLWWYGERCGAAPAKQAALSHWRRSARDFVQPSGATYQSIHYDLETGQISRIHCHHDAANDYACASQTHAWAVNGYSYAYQAAGEELFLETGRRVVDYALAHTPEDGVPFHNYEQYQPYRDTSASAITASSLLDWAQLDPDPQRRSQYVRAADHMLTGMLGSYLTPVDEQDERPAGMLLQGCYNYLGQVPSNELVWGSYFLMEALYKRLANETCFLKTVLD